MKKACKTGEVCLTSVLLEVWGKNACFTRPELKAERVSYEVMTPSAARGILEAIYWHPGLRWAVERIYVCAPIRYMNLRRNEVRAVVSAHTVRGVMERGRGELYLAASENIQQRGSLLLRDVRYVVKARFELTEKAGPGDNPGKFLNIFRRRIENGQCYHAPYLGCREFPAGFRACGRLPPCPEELRGERDLGLMLWDMDYSEPGDIRPLFFHAVLRDGVLEIPGRESGEVAG